MRPVFANARASFAVSQVVPSARAIVETPAPPADSSVTRAAKDSWSRAVAIRTVTASGIVQPRLFRYSQVPLVGHSRDAESLARIGTRLIENLATQVGFFWPGSQS